jgi:hypothetical protein
MLISMFHATAFLGLILKIKDESAGDNKRAGINHHDVTRGK